MGPYRDLDDHEYGSVDRVTFRHDGITYTVDYLWWDASAEEIEFGLEECLNPSEFVSLRIGSRTYDEIDNDKRTDEQYESDRDQDQEFEFHDVATVVAKLKMCENAKLDLTHRQAGCILVGTSDRRCGPNVRRRDSERAVRVEGQGAIDARDRR